MVKNRRLKLQSLSQLQPATKVFLIIIPVLVVVVLFLPPFSLLNRLFHLDYDRFSSKNGGITRLSDTAFVQVAPGDVQSSGRFKLEAFDGQTLAAMSASDEERQVVAQLPSDVVARGSLYHLAMSGKKPLTATVSLPVPADLPAVETADLYGWDGTRWVWIPSTLPDDSSMLTASVSPVLSYYLVGQTQAGPPRVILIGNADELADASDAQLFIVTGAYSQEDGSLAQVPALPNDSVKTLLGVSNVVDGVARSDWTFNLLANEASRSQHVNNLVASAQPYDGIELNYENLPADLRDAFTTLVSELATSLHQDGKILALRLASDSVLDWQALGAAADYINISIPAIPAQLVAEDGLPSQLNAITRMVDRRKVNLVLSAYSSDITSENNHELTYRQALDILAQGFSTENKNGAVLPGGEIIITLPNLKNEVQLDEDTQTYWFNYLGKDSIQHTVYLANTASVTRRLQYLSQYALGGVALKGANNPENDADIASAVKTFQANVVVPQPQFAIVWEVKDENGKVIIRHISSLSEPRLSWIAPRTPGNYIISSALSDDGGVSNLGQSGTLVLRVPSPTPAPTMTPTPTPTPEPTAEPTPEATEATSEPAAEPEEEPAAAPAPSGGGGFGYGIQADFMSDGDHERLFGAVQDLGLNWVKQQIEWFRYNPAPGVYDWGAIDRLVDGANARGINVLLSVVKAPGWARPAGDTDQGPPADPATFATFMREMAARYKGRVRAYEIWNEQNLYYEWGGRGGKLSAAKYVELLKAAYNAIKSVDPNAIVVSGALTPTGVTDYDISVDDRLYLEQMYQAGLANYCDAVGVHPSGFANSPDSRWPDAIDTTSPSHNNHPSFYFRSTMEDYRNIMVKYGDGWKKLWPTEFGWASVDGLGVGAVFGYEYANNNTESEQAQYIVRAYQMGRNWGWVGPMFLWNLNFAPVAGATDEKAAFGIVRQDWSHRPAYDAIKNMAKW